MFLRRYPEFAKNRFYIAGESYGGVYVPWFAREVIHGNKRGEKPYINITGYLVGNGVIEQDYDGNGHIT